VDRKINANKSIGLKTNVTIRVLDATTHEVVQEHVGHNTATNSMLLGIGHYLIGEGVLEQGYSMLSEYVPRYISIGTMGLINQESDSEGLPGGIGVSIPDAGDDEEYASLLDALATAESNLEAAKNALSNECPYYVENGKCYTGEVCEACTSRLQLKRRALEDAQAAYDEALDAVLTYSEETRFKDYMAQRPGYGADGYDENQNNNRKYFGLGPVFADREDKSKTINCELISVTYPRSPISYRDVVPEIESELPKTIDVVFSAMISVGALKQFRESGKGYVYITEAGLWSRPNWPQDWDTASSSYSGENDYYCGENGLLAGYRIAPPDEKNWFMTEEDAQSYIDDYIRVNTRSGEDPIAFPYPDGVEDAKGYAKYNRDVLRRNILKVGTNQVVQVIWKVQLGSIDQFGGINVLRYPVSL